MKNSLIVVMFSIVLGVLLSACSSIPLKTMYKLARTDMMNLNPMVLRAAVRMPASIRPFPDSVKLSLSMTLPGEEPKPEVFILQIVNVPAEKAPLQSEQRKGDEIWVYRLNPKDLSRFKQFRSDAKAMKAKTKGKAKGEMSVGVNMKDGCLRGKAPTSDELVATNWLKLDKESGFLPLVVDYDFSGVFKDKPLDEILKAC